MEQTKNNYIVEGYEFETYRQAEIFCGEHGIMCEEIYALRAE